jgi:DNA-binding beta-propeller fold protein YncE
MLRPMQNYPAKSALLLLCLFGAAVPLGAQTVPFVNGRLTKLWETKPELKTPQSVVFDSARQLIYVCNSAGGATADGGRGFISKISPEGEIVELEWITGLVSPKDMAVRGDRLFVSGNAELFEIDINRGRMRGRYLNDKAVDLRGVAASPTGAVYVADNGGRALFELRDGIFGEFMEDSRFERSSGLVVVGNELYTSVRNAVLVVNLRTHSVRRAFTSGNPIEGLVAVGDGTFLALDQSGVIYLLGRNGLSTKLLEVPAGKAGTTDICFVPGERMLLVSAHADNKLLAYRLN